MDCTMFVTAAAVGVYDTPECVTMQSHMHDGSPCRPTCTACTRTDPHALLAPIQTHKHCLHPYRPTCIACTRTDPHALLAPVQTHMHCLHCQSWHQMEHASIVSHRRAACQRVICVCRDSCCLRTSCWYPQVFPVPLCKSVSSQGSATTASKH